MQVYSSFDPQKQKNYYRQPFYKTKGFLVMFLIGLGLVLFIIWSLKTPVPQEAADLANDNAAEQTFAQITKLDGAIQVKKTDAFEAAEINDFFEPGAEVKTGPDSRAVITFPDGSLIRLEAETAVKFTQFNQSDIKIEMLSGRAFHRVSETSPAIYQVYNQRIELTALGTAFDTVIGTTITLSVIEGKVKTKIYDSNERENISNMRTVEEGQVAVFDIAAETDKSITTELKDLAYFLDDAWIVWNKEQDESLNFYLGIFAANVKLVIIEPAEAEFETEEEKLTIKGKTDSAAEIFIDGAEVDNKDGDFEHQYTLKEDKNVIEITVKKDKKINKKTLTVTYKKGQEPIAIEVTEETDKSAKIKFIVKTGLEYSTIKLLRSENDNPDLANSEIKTLNNADNYTTSDLKAGIYYFKACLVENNQCTEWSNVAKIELSNPEAATINLTGTKSDKTISLNWSLNQADNLIFNDFRVILVGQPDPTWPTERYHTVSKVTNSDSWPNLAPGSYYARICVFNDNQCQIYSNTLSFTIDAPVEPVVNNSGSVFLSGEVQTGKAMLSWKPVDLTAGYGYRVMMSFSPNVEYPKDIAYDSTGTGYTWTGLNSGDNYYFRVCVKSQTGNCQIYSNEIMLIIP